MINTLNKLLAKAAKLGILCRVARRDLVTTASLYAYDVVIFCHPDATKLLKIREILVLYDHTSGLHTNFAKGLVSPIECEDEVANEAVEAMGC